MAKHELLHFVHQQKEVHAKDVAEKWDLTEAGARATLHHLRREGLVRQVWVLTDQGTARLHHFEATGCPSPECHRCRKTEEWTEWLFGR